MHSKSKPTQQVIKSFDRGLKSMAMEGDGSRGYFTTLPEITGKDLAFNEENIKGVWLAVYSEYRDSDQPLTKSDVQHSNHQ